MPRITFKQKPHETGFPRACQWHIRLDKRNVGYVSKGRVGGWGWCVPADRSIGVEWRNSWAEGVTYDNPDDAKRDCRAYIEACIAALEEK